MSPSFPVSKNVVWSSFFFRTFVYYFTVLSFSDMYDNNIHLVLFDVGEVEASCLRTSTSHQSELYLVYLADLSPSPAPPAIFYLVSTVGSIRHLEIIAKEWYINPMSS